MQKLNQFIDHTLLKPTATEIEFISLFEQAITHSFFSVCVPPTFVPLAKTHFYETNVKIATVVGFPSGLNTTLSKTREAVELSQEGAHELDMVANLSWIKSGQWQKVENEISQIKQNTEGTLLKVIVESSLLNKDELLNCCLVVKESGAEFIKTSTGFNGPGAKVEDIVFMHDVLKNSSVKIKASGGIKNKKQALAFIDAGASRLGTSSGVQIIS